MITVAKKILVVDDEPAQLRLAEQVLTNNRYEVLKASSGPEALRIIFEKKPKLCEQRRSLLLSKIFEFALFVTLGILRHPYSPIFQNW